MPTGSVTYNNFADNVAFGLIIADMTDSNSVNYMTTDGAIVASTVSGSALDAKHNWWGHYLGPKGHPDITGRGSTTSDNVKLTVKPFLHCWTPSNFCVG